MKTIETAIRHRTISPATPQPGRPLAAPTHLSAAPGEGVGQVSLRWQPVKGAIGYQIQQATGSHGAGSWQAAGVSSKASFNATALNSNTRYWFRVCACSAAGCGAWSRPVTQIAP